MIGNIVLPVFFLYVILVSGYCSSLLNCGLQRFMRDSVYFKHFLIILSIYIFTFILNWYTFDSLAISQQEHFEKCISEKTCENIISQPFYVYPRSSIGKTPLRLANSVGIIDAQYRGNLIVQVDNISNVPYTIQKGQRLFQICSQDLTPFCDIKIVESLLDTERGSKGIGSTGK